jgi:two-component system, chemotaxis family, chemotaxis protein CheY
MSNGERYSTKILVVDDHPLTRNLVKSILRSQGFSDIYVAEDGTEGLRTIVNEAIECVICDWNMPNMTGIEVLRAVRKDGNTRNMPFIMLTAEAYRENVLAALQEGVSEYVIKPFTPQSLLEKVFKVLKIA